jgi:hypothetical protein
VSAPTTPDWSLLAREVPRLAEAIERLAARSGCEPSAILEALDEALDPPLARPLLYPLSGGKE